MAFVAKNNQLNEIVKCGKDPIHFINEYCKITHPKRGLIPFKTYKFQDDCIKNFIKHRFNIVLKSRQLGLSTVTAAYCVWLAMFYKEKNILVIATKLKTAINFVKKIKTILIGLPTWLKFTKHDGTKQEVRFSNGSNIQAIPTSEDAGRSEALSLLIVDEAAFIRNFEDIWTGLYPCLSEGGNAIILSTPNGVGGQYYQLYAGAEAKSNDFNPIKLLWNVHPEHDQAWFDKESKQLSKRRISQEMLCQFVGSGETYVNPDELAWLESIIKDPISTGDKLYGDRAEVLLFRAEKDIWIWEKPKNGNKYVISADVSRGDARDFSTFHIFDCSQGEIVAEFRGKISPDKFALLLDKYGRLYNFAYICPENNTFGYTTCTKLRELRYPKLVYQDIRLSQMDIFVPNVDSKIGFSTQARSRDLALTKLEELIRNKVIKSYSKRLVSELRTFVWNGTKASAMKDEFDDLVMSSAIGMWLFEGMYGNQINNDPTALLFLRMMETKTTRFDSIKGNGNEVRPMLSPGMIAYNVNNPRNQSDQRFDTDFKWLL